MKIIPLFSYVPSCTHLLTCYPPLSLIFASITKNLATTFTTCFTMIANVFDNNEILLGD